MVGRSLKKKRNLTLLDNNRANSTIRTTPVTKHRYVYNYGFFRFSQYRFSRPPFTETVTERTVFFFIIRQYASAVKSNLCGNSVPAIIIGHHNKSNIVVIILRYSIPCTPNRLSHIQGDDVRISNDQRRNTPESFDRERYSGANYRFLCSSSTVRILNTKIRRSAREFRSI